MRALQFLVSVNSQVVLYLIIVLANIDYQGVLDYSIKAFLGSAIWFGFKVLADRYGIKYKKGWGFLDPNNTREDDKTNEGEKK